MDGNDAQDWVRSLTAHTLDEERAQDAFLRLSADLRLKVAAVLPRSPIARDLVTAMGAHLTDPGFVVKAISTAQTVRGVTGSRAPRDRNHDGVPDREIRLSPTQVAVDVDRDGDIDMIEVESMPSWAPTPYVGLGVDDDEYNDNSDHWA